MKRVILASVSPRRRELMGMLGIPFDVLVSETEEVITSTDPAKVTEELSRQKAEAVAQQVTDATIVGADTVVALEGKILGKPKDKEEARKMITNLQGKSHMVYTGVTILKKGTRVTSIRTFHEETMVTVASMSKAEIEAYISTEEPYDKAGAYGIQGIFGRHIEGIKGDYYNVVGLPVHRIYKEIND